MRLKMGNIFKLDYCTEVRCDCFEFAYNGIHGFYDKSKDIHELFYNKKTYKFYPAVELSTHDDSNFFTEEDIDLLITLRDELDIEAFPFRKPNGEVTYIFLSKNWLMSQGLALLANSKDSKMFKLDEDKLFVNDKEINYREQCTFHIAPYGKLTYGIPFSYEDTKEIILLHTVKAGCKVSYLRDLLPYLPLNVTYVELEASNIVYRDDYGTACYYDNKLSKFPVNKVDGVYIRSHDPYIHIQCSVHNLVEDFTFTGMKGKYVLDKDTDRVTSMTIGDILLHPDENNETTYIANGRVPIGFLRKLKDIDPNCKRIVYRLKPLERWTTKDKNIYLDSQSFEFNNQVGVINIGLNGNYSVMWGSHLYESSDVREELGSELEMAIEDFLKADRKDK